jgi:ABC-type phosphate transport system substrate-binding protein
MMVYKALNVNPSMTQAKAQALVNFLWFIVNEGQAQATPLSYVPLPQSAVTVDETTLRSITFNSQTLHT